MGRVVHFEITADDPQRASRFYQDVFGWQVQKYDGPIDYWLATTGQEGEAGIDGAIMPREGTQHTILTIAVDDFDAAIRMVEQAGGKQASEKSNIPGVGDFCYATDSEGNMIGILQPVPPAG